MATATLGLYSSFSFDSPEEEKAAMTLNVLQKMYLQNLRYDCVQARDAIVVDYEHPQKYFHEKIQLDAKIDMLTALINLDPERDLTTNEGDLK